MTKAKATTKIKHSKDLKTTGPVPDFIKEIKINKNIEIPVGWSRSSQWDHLIIKMEKGDSVDRPFKEAVSLSGRARNLGYLVVMRKIDENLSRVWFEGLNPNHKAKK